MQLQVNIFIIKQYLTNKTMWNKIKVKVKQGFRRSAENTIKDILE